MKKIILVAIMAIMTTSAFAQIVSSQSSRITREKKEARTTSSIFVDLGVGVFTGDTYDTGAGVDLGFRWNRMFTPNIGWDILKISAQTDTKHFTESLNVQAKSGIRGVSPVLFGNSSIYANAAAGYAYFTDPSDGGFVWEVGAGLNVTPRFAVGVAYNSIHINDADAGLVSLRLSYGF